MIKARIANWVSAWTIPPGRKISVPLRLIWLSLIILHTPACLSSAASSDKPLEQVSTGSSLQEEGEIKKQAACVKPYQWRITKTGTTLAKPQSYLNGLAKQPLILLGEHHDDADHHRWQLQVLHMLYAYQPDMVIGFEMFPRSVQPVLDRWVAGELDEKAFLEQVAWERNWSFDAQWYLPIFHFARMNHIPMVALNVDRELVAKIREKGWEKVPEQDRQGVRDPAPMSEDYIRFMQDVFKQHLPHQSAKEKSEEKDSAKKGKEQKTPDESAAVPGETSEIQRFMQGQLVWDGSMAQVLASRLKPGQLTVGIMGSGHVVNGFGVPLQLRAMGVETFVSLVPWHEQFDCNELNVKFADAVVGFPPQQEEEMPQKPKLGIYMEPHASGVRIAKVVGDSVAEKTGLLAEDIVIEMAGQPITKSAQVAELVGHMLAGAWLPIKIKRNDQVMEFVAKFPAVKYRMY